MNETIWTLLGAVLTVFSFTPLSPHYPLPSSPPLAPSIIDSYLPQGGVEVICCKLSRATSRALHPVRGVVSTVIHQLGVKIHSKIEGEKHLLAAAWESDKPLVNFAPYGKVYPTSGWFESLNSNTTTTGDKYAPNCLKLK